MIPLTNYLGLSYDEIAQTLPRFRVQVFFKSTANKCKREKIIEETVLPNSYNIQAGSVMQGYVVFLGNTPNYGPAKVYLPLFKSKDVEFHRFEFPFEF